MSEDFFISSHLSKKEKYEELYKVLVSLVSSENDLIANLANTCAALNQTFPNLWIGFYLVKNNELVLGPFQGPVACTRIALGRGVCGTAWKEAKTIIVPDVEKFPGHIACSSLSKSEIVVPVFKYSKVVAVLDIDSTELNNYDETDAEMLEKICEIVSGFFE